MSLDLSEFDPAKTMFGITAKTEMVVPLTHEFKNSMSLIIDDLIEYQRAK